MLWDRDHLTWRLTKYETMNLCLKYVGTAAQETRSVTKKRLIPEEVPAAGCTSSHGRISETGCGPHRACYHLVTDWAHASPSTVLVRNEALPPLPHTSLCPAA
jgi:hypothetical protein